MDDFFDFFNFFRPNFKILVGDFFNFKKIFQNEKKMAKKSKKSSILLHYVIC